ncbi:MAG TPA: hypothetical protein VLS96_01125, partial [Nodosilinea sp.]|nr:hypothetical protein [Nodosilinea sp.]
IFCCGITLIYILVVAWLDFLRGPNWWDETDFWKSSLTFSDSLLPSLSDLKNYNSLNTPLPFMMFGLLEYLFGQGIFAGRLLNLVLSLGIVLIIGWPSRDKGGRALLCLVGLFLCPYFLFLSGRLYTEMIACTWVLLGFVAYLRDRHGLSCLAFVLAIASRQYMLAFPMAIAAYELLGVADQYRQQRQFSLQQQWRWVAPALACLSMAGWILLFQGLAPEEAIIGKSPEVQKSLIALTPGGAVNYLAFVGAYIVIPEFLLFGLQPAFQELRQRPRKGLLIAAGLLFYCLIFPPLTFGNGFIVNLADLLPLDSLRAVFFYSLALLACLRFAQLDLLFWILVFNTLIMTKALPWDRYVLPAVVIFWYLKSIRYPERLAVASDTQERTEGSTAPTGESQLT